jgi:hypothetical protein
VAAPEVLPPGVAADHSEVDLVGGSEPLPLPGPTRLCVRIPAALLQVVGTYGIAIVSTEAGGTLFAARMGSPLILGVSDSSFHIARCASSLRARF